MQKHKVIGVGFHKTGTTTLGHCLQLLGYHHISHSREAFLLYHASEISAVLTLMAYFDSFEDWPWPLLYREIYERFPESKFILTTRINEDVWFDSLTRHVQRGAGEAFTYRKYMYGYENPNDNKPVHIETYRQHNRVVREFFADKAGSLLEVCWERGDGWHELCSFLGVAIPNMPFPHNNRAPNRRNLQGKLAKRVRMALRVLLTGK